MKIDVKTLFVANILITAFIGLALLLYRKNRKTYPGFRCWIAGNFAITAGYMAFLSRTVVVESVSVILTNCLLFLGILLRLDGSSAFIRDRRVHRSLYLLPLLMAGLLTYGHLTGMTPPVRGATVSTMVALLAGWNALIFINNRNKLQSPISMAMGLAMLLWVFFLMQRALFWLQNPTADTFESNFYQIAYTMTALILEVILSTGIFMLNGARLEEELIQTNRSLDAALTDLKATMGELKVLTGILPICSHCKKIRDGETGGWQRMERYISKHSNADFTHSICPDCMKEHYPDVKEPE